jgi:hypothetical protein
MKTFASRSWLLALAALALITTLSAVPAHAASGPFQYHAITPCRVFDTRQSGSELVGPLNNPGPFTARVQGNCGVPVGAAAVSANFTVVSASRPGDVRVFPAGAGTPTTSTVNYPAGTTVANGALTPLATVTGTAPDIQVVIGMTASGTIQLVMDVTGYFE